jgi:hypothetical protein
MAIVKGEFEYPTEQLLRSTSPEDIEIQQERTRREIQVTDLKTKYNWPQINFSRNPRKLRSKNKDVPTSNEWKKYEDFCLDLINLTFENEFKHKAKRQDKDIKIHEIGTTRKDIVINNLIKSSSTNIFWNRLFEDYGCGKILFECKNYDTEIDAIQIYQVFGYLSCKRERHSFGRLAIILSRKGELSKQARRALWRIQQEKKPYFILILNDEDIDEWLNHYTENGEISDFFELKFYDNEKINYYD